MIRRFVILTQRYANRLCTLAALPLLAVLVACLAVVSMGRWL